MESTIRSNNRKRGYAEAFDLTYNTFLSASVAYTENNSDENIVSIEEDLVQAPEYCDNQMDFLLMDMANLCISIHSPPK